MIIVSYDLYHIYLNYSNDLGLLSSA